MGVCIIKCMPPNLYIQGVILFFFSNYHEFNYLLFFII